MKDEAENTPGEAHERPDLEPEENVAEETAVEESREEAAKEEEKPAEEKIEDLKDKYEKEIIEIKEKMLRIAADFDNYKKRIQRELQEREERAKGEALKIILPTIDNLRRAVGHLNESDKLGSIIDGMKIIEKNFIETLEKAGIKRLETIGKAFDPEFHEAVAHQESEEFPAGTVMAEVQGGYMFGEKLLRAALVVVSRGKPEEKKVEEAVAVEEQGVEKNQEGENLSG